MTSTRGNPVPPFDAALPYTVAAALALVIGRVVAVPTSVLLGLSALLMAVALGTALGVYVNRERLRAEADAWLAETRSPSPFAFAWRVDELVRSERKLVGRTLRSFGEEVLRPPRRGAPILNRSRLRPETGLLFEVARALQDADRAVSPGAIARARLLITDCGSPLNCSERHDELHRALESILADLSMPGATGENGMQALPRGRGTAPQMAAAKGER